MYNEQKVKQLAKALKKSVKQTMKDDANHIYVMEEFWTGLEELLSCIYCPCGEKCSGDDKCSKLLMDWYKESEE